MSSGYGLRCFNFPAYAKSSFGIRTLLLTLAVSLKLPFYFLSFILKYILAKQYNFYCTQSFRLVLNVYSTFSCKFSSIIYIYIYIYIYIWFLFKAKVTNEWTPINLLVRSNYLYARCEGMWRNGYIAALLLNLGARWRWMVSFTPRSIYPCEKRAGSLWMGDWMGSTASLDIMEKRKISCHC